MAGSVSSRKAGAAYTIATAFLILAVVGATAQMGTRIYQAVSPANTLQVPATIAPEELDIRGLPERWLSLIHI